MKYYLLIILSSMLLTCCIKKTYQGEKPDAYIIRDKITKKASIVINEQGDWKLYSGTNPDKINWNTPILKNKGIGNFDIPVNNHRYYFCIETDKGRALLAESILPMEGGYNFRDLGGIKNKEGKYVKWGTFIRADELGKLTHSDLTYLENLPLVSLIDFRSKDEINAEPDKIPSSIKHIYPLSITPGSLSFKTLSDLLMNDSAVENMDNFMILLYRSFVTDSTCINVYREFFSIIQQEDKTPLLYHCTAGKDRTGFASAMILYALNVDEETIMKNYLESNIYLKDKYKPIIEKYPQSESVFAVKPEYLQTSIAEIKFKHGSVEKYLETVLQVDIKKIRKMYLN